LASRSFLSSSSSKATNIVTGRPLKNVKNVVEFYLQMKRTSRWFDAWREKARKIDLRAVDDAMHLPER
jgi:hypothetical protein